MATRVTDNKQTTIMNHLAPTVLALSLSLPLVGCGGSTSADDAKTEKPKGDAKSDDAKSDDAKPDDAKPEPAEAPAGYSAHLLTALTELGAGEAVTLSETTAYGCGVKYADAGAEATAVLGQPAPAFTLPDLDGAQVSLADFAGKTVVLEWFNPDCPFVRYAHGEGPLATLGNEQTKAGVVWLAINSGAPGKQGAGVERNKQAKAEWKIEHPILIDEDGAVGHSYGAKTTPHMFVINPAGELVYAGGLDNAPLGRVDG
ncbi:putative peroxiredoxin bcp [Enhygromyxa salina]|uniref:Putative peroxiredoxin bcp n=1 Tax=Enhygromyxa salina TaxID=215803 RepID=A0A2S9XAW2_9BACT|nr:redoxin domain-containing protein [Enhygromyxa salina]PRP89995.1 putative peroxiredoxin bcp [Enhygromyxa salina]